eukprot:gene4010-2864_t
MGKVGGLSPRGWGIRVAVNCPDAAGVEPMAMETLRLRRDEASGPKPWEQFAGFINGLVFARGAAILKRRRHAGPAQRAHGRSRRNGRHAQQQGPGCDGTPRGRLAGKVEHSGGGRADAGGPGAGQARHDSGAWVPRGELARDRRGFAKALDSGRELAAQNLPAKKAALTADMKKEQARSEHLRRQFWDAGVEEM